MRTEHTGVKAALKRWRHNEGTRAVGVASLYAFVRDALQCRSAVLALRATLSGVGSVRVWQDSRELLEFSRTLQYPEFALSQHWFHFLQQVQVLYKLIFQT